MSRDVVELIDDAIADYNEQMPDAMRWSPDAPHIGGGDPYDSGGYTSGPPLNAAERRRQTRAFNRMMRSAGPIYSPWGNGMSMQVMISANAPTAGSTTLVHWSMPSHTHPPRGARRNRPKHDCGATVTFGTDRRIRITTNGRMRIENIGLTVIPLGEWVQLSFLFWPKWPPPLKAGDGEQYHRRQMARRHRRRR